MTGFLHVSDATNLPCTPTNSFLADEDASICLLITPSPPTNDLINPLPDPTEPNLGMIGHELATKLQNVQDDDKADSSSSSSSALAEPACAQLLNHRNVYHHMVKNEDTEVQEANGRTQTLQLTFRNPPDNYFFMSWNWPLIRKISLWIFMSGLIAMGGIVIAMIYSLPKKCNPETQWYQGNVFYEIFPASFNAENNMGDLKGISENVDYFVNLKVKAIRLNSIFPTTHYPEDFENITSLKGIQSNLGTLQDFRKLVGTIKSKNISLILDLPVYPFVKVLSYRKNVYVKNESNAETEDKIEDALKHWVSHGVDGFYMKGLEYLVDDPNFAPSLRIWKKILGPDRIIIVSEAAINQSPKSIQNIVLNNIDLVDIKLNLSAGADAVKQQIGSLQNGTLFSRPGMPWIHWSLGNVNSRRLANSLPFGNTTLGATLFQLMLPGTPSIFYGDERAISNMTALREVSPAIYMNSVYKEGMSKVNAEVKYVEKFLVIQRWYPRKKAYMLVCNLQTTQLSADLSTVLYSGQIVVGPTPTPGSISFKDVSLWPGESVVIELN